MLLRRGITQYSYLSLLSNPDKSELTSWYHSRMWNLVKVKRGGLWTNYAANSVQKVLRRSLRIANYKLPPSKSESRWRRSIFVRSFSLTLRAAPPSTSIGKSSLWYVEKRVIYRASQIVFSIPQRVQQGPRRPTMILYLRKHFKLRGCAL